MVVFCQKCRAQKLCQKRRENDASGEEEKSKNDLRHHFVRTRTFDGNSNV